MSLPGRRDGAAMEPGRSAGDWRLGGAWDSAPMLLDAIAADGTVLACNATHAAALGYDVDEVTGKPAERFYLRASAARLRELIQLLDPGAVQRHLRLDLRRRDGRPLRVSASVDVMDGADGRTLRLAKLPLDPALEGAEQLARENETLHSIVATSKDALWCIEFAEPVDLTAPAAEAVRQVFENVSYWRLCNKAMARLYKLPETLDFNEQHVRVAFPRNPENEAFVQQLIEHDFNMDGAPSLDHRYDGLDVYVENDVRGHIENGMLHRMWGAARDLSEQRRKELDLASRLDATLEVLSAVPDPILVIGQDGVLEAANPAVEWRFGWPIDEVLGRAASALVRFPDGFDPAADSVAPGGANQTLDVAVRAADGSSHACRAHLAALAGTARGRRIVLTLRPEVAPAAEVQHRRRAAAGPVG
jgi:PAS domain-containing protein